MPTELYLIRHGIAAERGTYANDGERPLTEAGVSKTQRVAKRLHALNLQFGLILTSPLLRARQTAEILQAAGLSQRIEELVHLAPEGNIQDYLSWLAAWQQLEKEKSSARKPDRSLALVGHEPNLGHWAEILVWGEARGRLVVKKAGVVSLTFPEVGSPVGKSSMLWLASPKLLLS